MLRACPLLFPIKRLEVGYLPADRWWRRTRGSHAGDSGPLVPHAVVWYIR
jgi:hypothetical protein